MHHAVEPQILHIGDGAGDLGRNIDARQRAADDGEGLRILELRTRLRLDVQNVVGDELAKRYATAVGRNNRAAFGFEVCGRDREPLRGKADEDLTRLGSGMPNRGAALGHGLAAGGEALVRSSSGIGRNERDRAGRNAELLGGELDQRRLDALAQLGFAGEHGQVAAVGIPANSRR